MEKRHKKRNQGIITLPFLLVLVIVLFFTLSFLMLAMTLVHVTVTQYMTYSSARKLSLAGESSVTQLAGAMSHYEKLREQFFKPSAHTGKPGDWFFIQEQLKEKELQYSSVQAEYSKNTPHPQQRFYGVNTSFTTLALNLKIPFLMEDDSDDINKQVRVSSFLGREPSLAECEEFHEKKREKIKEKCNPSDCPHIKPPEEFKGDNGC